MGTISANSASTDCRLSPFNKKEILSSTSFSGDFAIRAQYLAADLKTFRYEDESSADYFNTLVSRVETIVNEALGKTQFTFEEAQALYTISDEVKKHNRRPHTMWEALNKSQQQFIQKLAPFTEHPEAVIRDCIGGVYFNYAKDVSEGVYNFGDGRLFKVSHVGNAVKQDCAEFPLTNYPGHSLFFPDKFINDKNYADILSEAEKEIIKNGEVVNIGKMGELFPIQTLIAQIKAMWRPEHLFYALGDRTSLLMLYRFYVQSIHESLGIPVVKPKAIDSKGRWEIRSNTLPVPLSKLDFTQIDAGQLSSMARDIVKHLQVEKEWNLAICGEKTEDMFALHEGKTVLYRHPTLPKQIVEDIKIRHQRILDDLKKYPALEVKVKELLPKTDPSGLPRNIDFPENFRSDFQSCLNFAGFYPLVTVNTQQFSLLLRNLFTDIPRASNNKSFFNVSRTKSENHVKTQLNNEKLFRERFYAELCNHLKSMDAPMSEPLSAIALEKLESLVEMNNISSYMFAINIQDSDHYASPTEYLMLRLSETIVDEIENISLNDNGLKILCRSPFDGSERFKEKIWELLHERMVAQIKENLPKQLLNDLHALQANVVDHFVSKI